MRFDSSAATQAAMCRALKLDPRMIRFTVIKLAQRLGTRGQIAGVEAVEGRVDWMAVESWKDTEVGDFVGRHNQRLSPSFSLGLPEEGDDVE
jgi:Ribosomal protein S6